MALYQTHNKPLNWMIALNQHIILILYQPIWMCLNANSRLLRGKFPLNLINSSLLAILKMERTTLKVLHYYRCRINIWNKSKNRYIFELKSVSHVYFTLPNNLLPTNFFSQGFCWHTIIKNINKKGWHCINHWLFRKKRHLQTVETFTYC